MPFGIVSVTSAHMQGTFNLGVVRRVSTLLINWCKTPTVSYLINTPLKNNYRSWVVHNYSMEINVLVQVAHLLERRKCGKRGFQYSVYIYRILGYY